MARKVFCKVIETIIDFETRQEAESYIAGQMAKGFYFINKDGLWERFPGNAGNCITYQGHGVDYPYTAHKVKEYYR